jgi:hypothetical protein
MAEGGLPFSLQDLAFAKLSPEALKQLVEQESEDVTRPIVASASRAHKLVQRLISQNDAFLFNDGTFSSQWTGLADQMRSIVVPGAVITPLQVLEQRSIGVLAPAYYVALETRALHDMFPNTVRPCGAFPEVVFPKEAEHAAEEAALVLHATVADLLALPPPTVHKILDIYHRSRGYYYEDKDFHMHAATFGMSVQEQAVVWNALFGTDLPHAPRRSKRKRPDPMPDATNVRVQNDHDVPGAFLKGLPGATLCSAFFESFGVLATANCPEPNCRRCKVHDLLGGTLHTLTHHLFHVPHGAHL